MPQASAGAPIPQVEYAFQHQPDAVLDQAAPVQNTWYTVLAATDDVRLYNVAMYISTTSEDLGIRITVDGNILLGAFGGATVNAVYNTRFEDAGPDALRVENTSFATYKAYFLEGQSVTIEVRKTTAAGTGNLHCIVKWAKLLPT